MDVTQARLRAAPAVFGASGIFSWAPCFALVLVLVLALSFALAFPSAAFAWGSIGHRVVGQVADLGLTPAAAAQVSKIIGTNSLGDVATWMDDVRNKPEGHGLKAWHFESVGACDASKATCLDKNCAGPQIEAAIATLRSGKGDQLKALRVLVHLIGDIHQPLHTAENNGDFGGNFVILTNRKCIDAGGNSIDCNLHTYWDNSLVKAALGKQTERDFVAMLSKMSVNTAGDAESWVRESNGLAKTKVHTYEGFACQIGPNRVALDAGYDQAAIPAVTEQLAKAGQRLAAVLNDIYP